MEIPADYEFLVDGSCYKVGRFNRVFMWNNGEWVQSSKKPKQLMPRQRRRSGTSRKAIDGGPFKKARVFKAIQDFGQRNKDELLDDTGLDAMSIRYALKDLCGAGKLVLSNGYYRLPRTEQTDLFRMVAL